jgi:hypothetical protein
MTIIEQKSIVMFNAKDETKKCVAARLWWYVYGRRRAKERECLATGSSRAQGSQREAEVTITSITIVNADVPYVHASAYKQKEDPRDGVFVHHSM